MILQPLLNVFMNNIHKIWYVFYSILKSFAFAYYLICVKKNCFSFKQMDHLGSNVLNINKINQG